MAYDNTLYKYEWAIATNGIEESGSGHAETQGKARQHIQRMIDQRKQEGIEEKLTKFSFNGRECPVD